MSTPEGEVRNAILDYLKWHRLPVFIHDSVGIFDPVQKVYRKRGGRHYSRGVPDLIGLIPPWGRFFAIEVKSATGRLTPEQKAWIDVFNAGGGLAFMARSVNDVEKIFKPILMRRHEPKIPD